MSIHGILFTFISSFIALFSVINPLGGGFIVDGFLTGLDDIQRKKAIHSIIINFLLIGIGSLVVGHLILLLLNLAVPVIQLGGGFLICKTALGWLSDSLVSTGSNNSKAVGAVNLKDIESEIFYPFSFPICIGPGSISVIFTLMASFGVKGSLLKTGINYLIIALAILCMCVILYVFLVHGNKVMKRLGTSGNLIINKLVGFFTFCIGIQIIVTGISKIFHLNIL